jgi:hypothetical protein
MRLAALLVVVACSEKSAPPAPAPADPPKAAPADAARPGVTSITGFDPNSGMHLDDDVGTRPVPPPRPSRAPHPIEITLRSSPGGAQAAVDGQPVGNTPAFWAGDADGREHTFTFVSRGYAAAIYRFVPVASGVIHARLEPITDENSDAGVPPPELVQPPPAAIAPPPTVVQPAPDAAPPSLPASPVGPTP